MDSQTPAVSPSKRKPLLPTPSRNAWLLLTIGTANSLALMSVGVFTVAVVLIGLFVEETGTIERRKLAHGLVKDVAE